MKKFIAASLFLLMFATVPTDAAIGDILQPIYSTDILTYMDGLPIKGYNIGGQTLICLEDLSNYGFNVYFDEDIKCVFANKIGQPREGLFPVIERASAGNVIGYTLETDVKAIVNGEEIHAENIGGKVAVSVEALDDLKDGCLTGSLSIKNYPKYFIMQSYNNSARVLNVYSDIGINYLYADNISKFEADIKNSNVAIEIIDKYTYGDFTQYIYKGASRTVFPDESLTAVRFYKNGNVLDYTNILYAYSFIGSPAGTSLYDFETKPAFSEDGKYLVFKANRTKSTGSIMGLRDTFESGEYKLNLNTCALEKIK